MAAGESPPLKQGVNNCSPLSSPGGNQAIRHPKRHLHPKLAWQTPPRPSSALFGPPLGGVFANAVETAHDEGGAAASEFNPWTLETRSTFFLFVPLIFLCHHVFQPPSCPAWQRKRIYHFQIEVLWIFIQILQIGSPLIPRETHSLQLSGIYTIFLLNFDYAFLRETR